MTTTPPRELRESYRFCCRIARREAKNFYYAFLLLPPARRRSMCALYAFMRHTDDLADEGGTADQKAKALDGWRIELDNAIAGRGSAWPGFPALADTVARHSIPPTLLHEVIEGVSMDIVPRSYETFEQLRDYCYHVASVVGLCCIHIWGFRSDSGRAERLAESCGIALQLTNIIRDVREDASNGRIYLPQEDLDRFSVRPEDLLVDHPNDRLKSLLEFEGERAYSFYREGSGLVPLVAPVGRPVLRTIVGIYRSLLDEIARRNYDVLAGRVSIPAWRKTAIAARSLAGSLTAGSGTDTGPDSGPRGPQGAGA